MGHFSKSALSKVLSIQEVDYNQVIVKVDAKDPLTVAKYPFLSSDYAYITVTRGKEHIFTVVHEDATTFDFHFGSSGHTLISEGLEELKNQVMGFIADNGIFMEYDGEKPIDKATIYFNNNFNQWQLTLYDKNDYYVASVRTDKATDLESAKEIFSDFIKTDSWEKTKSDRVGVKLSTKDFEFLEVEKFHEDKEEEMER